MKNSEFIWIKGQLKIVLLYELVSDTIKAIIFGIIIWLFLPLFTDNSVTLSLKTGIVIIGILLLIVWVSEYGINKAKMIHLKRLWKEGVDKEKAIKELGLLPK